MAKTQVNLDVEISRVAVRRDQLLRGVSRPLSAIRLQRLQVVLANAYPLEAALKKIAEERDRSLELAEDIPSSVELVLANRLRLLANSSCDAKRAELFVQ